MQSKIFTFFQTREESVDYLKSLQKHEEKFVDAVALGEQIKKLCNEDDLPKLKETIDSNIPNIPKIQIFLEEAFNQAVLYRYDDIIEYFLTNGYKIDESKHLITLVQTSRFLHNDPPVEVLDMLLKYGASTEQTDPEKYRTPIHLSCKYGIAPFVMMLVERGADINSVDKAGKTPLQYLEAAMKKKKGLEGVHQFLVEKGAKLTWKDELPNKYY